MNSLEQKIAPEAARYANILLARASKNEPPITADLQKIALETAAEMAGLEHKFKTKASLTEKLLKNSSKHLSYISAERNANSATIEKSVARTARQNNDALRYTFLVSIEKYVFCFKEVLSELEKSDYEIPSKYFWNAWKNVGTKYDKGYRGINITVISSQRQKFELQFHTEQSFRLKNQMHEMYKEAGLAATSVERKLEIIEIMVESAKNISVPRGAIKL